MKWTEEDLNYLKENYPKNIPLKNISEKLNRTTRSIHHQAARNEIHRPHYKIIQNPSKESAKIIDRRYYEKNKEKVYKRKMNRRKKLKKEMVEILGGKCSICGYNKCVNALEFHHKKDKERAVAKLLKDNSREKVLKEVKKCILLCANCHRELHFKGP